MLRVEDNGNTMNMNTDNIGNYLQGAKDLQRKLPVDGCVMRMSVMIKLRKIPVM